MTVGSLQGKSDRGGECDRRYLPESMATVTKGNTEKDRLGQY